MTLLSESCTLKLLTWLVLHLRAHGPTINKGALHKQGTMGCWTAMGQDLDSCNSSSDPTHCFSGPQSICLEPLAPLETSPFQASEMAQPLC